MKFQTITSATILSILCSCSNRQEQKSQSKSDTISNHQVQKVDTTSLRQVKYLKDDGDSIIVDPFEIEIVLSNKAKERIQNSGETIKVSIFYYGYPKDEKKANSEKDGTLYLTGTEKELSYGQIARFENIKISKKDYEELIDKDFELNLNVFSGRKSSKDNLLDCEPLFDKVSSVVNKRHILKGKLIYGDE
jgi:hypothetical protein